MRLKNTYSLRADVIKSIQIFKTKFNYDRKLTTIICKDKSAKVDAGLPSSKELAAKELPGEDSPRHIEDDNRTLVSEGLSTCVKRNLNPLNNIDPFSGIGPFTSNKSN